MCGCCWWVGAATSMCVHAKNLIIDKTFSNAVKMRFVCFEAGKQSDTRRPRKLCWYCAIDKSIAGIAVLRTCTLFNL